VNKLKKLALVFVAVLLLLLAVTTFASTTGCASPHCAYLPATHKGQSSTTHPDACRWTPRLISPVDGSTVSTLSPSFTVNLVGHAHTWEEHLRAEVARDAHFHSAVTHANMTLGNMPIGQHGALRVTWQWPHNLEPGTTYYWRAWGECGLERSPGAYSPTWSFTTAADIGGLPAAPSLVVPADGSTVEAGLVIFEWTPVEGAESYLITWRRAGTLASKGGRVFGTSGAHTFESEGVYEWWVVAVNSIGYSPDSELRRLTISGYPD
jgi:hypothetical protein